MIDVEMHPFIYRDEQTFPLFTRAQQIKEFRLMGYTIKQAKTAWDALQAGRDKHAATQTPEQRQRWEDRQRILRHAERVDYLDVMSIDDDDKVMAVADYGNGKGKHHRSLPLFGMTLAQLEYYLRTSDKLRREKLGGSTA